MVMSLAQSSIIAPQIYIMLKDKTMAVTRNIFPKNASNPNISYDNSVDKSKQAEEIKNKTQQDFLDNVKNDLVKRSAILNEAINGYQNDYNDNKRKLNNPVWRLKNRGNDKGKAKKDALFAKMQVNAKIISQLKKADAAIKSCYSKHFDKNFIDRFRKEQEPNIKEIEDDYLEALVNFRNTGIYSYTYKEEDIDNLGNIKEIKKTYNDLNAEYENYDVKNYIEDFDSRLKNKTNEFIINNYYNDAKHFLSEIDNKLDLWGIEKENAQKSVDNAPKSREKEIRVRLDRASDNIEKLNNLRTAVMAEISVKDVNAEKREPIDLCNSYKKIVVLFYNYKMKDEIPKIENEIAEIESEIAKIENYESIYIKKTKIINALQEKKTTKIKELNAMSVRDRGIDIYYSPGGRELYSNPEAFNDFISNNNQNNVHKQDQKLEIAETKSCEKYPDKVTSKTNYLPGLEEMIFLETPGMSLIDDKSNNLSTIENELKYKLNALNEEYDRKRLEINQEIPWTKSFKLEKRLKRLHNAQILIRQYIKNYFLNKSPDYGTVISHLFVLYFKTKNVGVSLDNVTNIIKPYCSNFDENVVWNTKQYIALNYKKDFECFIKIIDHQIKFCSFLVNAKLETHNTNVLNDLKLRLTNEYKKANDNYNNKLYDKIHNNYMNVVKMCNKCKYTSDYWISSGFNIYEHPISENLKYNALFFDELFSKMDKNIATGSEVKLIENVDDEKSHAPIKETFC
jgi:hypothetical protein